MWEGCVIFWKHPASISTLPKTRTITHSNQCDYIPTSTTTTFLRAKYKARASRAHDRLLSTLRWGSRWHIPKSNASAHTYHSIRRRVVTRIWHVEWRHGLRVLHNMCVNKMNDGLTLSTMFPDTSDPPPAVRIMSPDGHTDWTLAAWWIRSELRSTLPFNTDVLQNMERAQHMKYLLKRIDKVYKCSDTEIFLVRLGSGEGVYMVIL